MHTELSQADFLNIPVSYDVKKLVRAYSQLAKFQQQVRSHPSLLLHRCFKVVCTQMCSNILLQGLMTTCLQVDNHY